MKNGRFHVDVSGVFGRSDIILVLTCNSGRYIVKFMVKGESFAQDSADAGVFSE
jgi:hypothetical protein